jgi:hypothetical protein
MKLNSSVKSKAEIVFVYDATSPWSYAQTLQLLELKAAMAGEISITLHNAGLAT